MNICILILVCAFNVGRKQASFQDILLYIQVAGIEWILGVQIQRFDNLYNAEIRNGEYCCCDSSRDPCEERVMDLSGRCNGANSCQHSFFVRFQRCLDSSTCLDIKSYRLRNRTNLPLDQLVLYIPIDVDLGENVKV